MDHQGITPVRGTATKGAGYVTMTGNGLNPVVADMYGPGPGVDFVWPFLQNWKTSVSDVALCVFEGGWSAGADRNPRGLSLTLDDFRGKVVLFGEGTFTDARTGGAVYALGGEDDVDVRSSRQGVDSLLVDCHKLRPNETDMAALLQFLATCSPRVLVLFNYDPGNVTNHPLVFSCSLALLDVESRRACTVVDCPVCCGTGYVGSRWSSGVLVSPEVANFCVCGAGTHKEELFETGYFDQLQDEEDEFRRAEEEYNWSVYEEMEALRASRVRTEAPDAGSDESEFDTAATSVTEDDGEDTDSVVSDWSGGVGPGGSHFMGDDLEVPVLCARVTDVVDVVSQVCPVCYSLSDCSCVAKDPWTGCTVGKYARDAAGRGGGSPTVSGRGAHASQGTTLVVSASAPSPFPSVSGEGGLLQVLRELVPVLQPVQGRPSIIFPIPYSVGTAVYAGAAWVDCDGTDNPQVVQGCLADNVVQGAGGALVPHRKFDVPVVYNATNWKRLPVLLRNAVNGGAPPRPTPSFPKLGISWYRGCLDEHFAAYATSLVGVRASPVPGHPFGPLVLEPVSGGVYTECGGGPETFLPPVHTWSGAEDSLFGRLAIEWRNKHFR